VLRRLTEKHGPLSVFVEYPVLIQLGIICTCAEMAWATLLVVMQFYFKEELLVGDTPQTITAHVAQAMFAFVAFETLFKYPMGHLADRYGVRRFILFALGLCTITPFLARFCTQWYSFIPLRAMDGLAAAALWPSMSALMARSVPREAKASAMSVFNGAYMFGIAVGPLTGLMLGKILGTNRAVFPLCAALMGIGFFTAYRAIPHHVETSQGDVESFSEDRHMLDGRPMLVRMLFLYALAQLGMGVLGPTLPVYLQEHFGLVQANLAKPLAIPALIIALAAIPLGRVADHIGRALAVWISYGMATAGVLLISLSSMYPPNHHQFSQPLEIFIAGGLLLVLSYIVGTPAWLGLTSLQVDDRSQGKVLSLMQTAQGLGVVAALGIVGCGAAIMAWQARVEIRFHHVMSHLHHHVRPLVLALPPKLHDTVPLSVWFWGSTCIYFVVFLGTVFVVREPAHPDETPNRAGTGAAAPELVP